MLCNSKLKIAIMIIYASQFSAIYVLCHKEYAISVNINSNNGTVNFKDDIVVKLSLFSVAELSPRVTFMYPLHILHQFVAKDSNYNINSITSMYFAMSQWSKHFHKETVYNFHDRISAVMNDIIIKLVTEHLEKSCKSTLIVCSF